MGRPPLAIGTYGEIHYLSTSSGWEARAKFRDGDGITRQVSARGKAKTAARNRLKDKLAQRTGRARSGEITGDTRLHTLAPLWFTEQKRLAAQGDKEMSTVQQYEDHYRRHIEKALGALTIRELGDVAPIHNFLVTKAEASSSTAVMCRKVLSGMLGWAVIHKALGTNPVRDVGRVKRTPKKTPRALEVEQVRDWLRQADRDDYAVQWDLPFISRAFLATGPRIGELLALNLDDNATIDLDGRFFYLAHRLVYLKGMGVVRRPSTKSHRDRRVDFPPWFATALSERIEDLSGMGPLFPHPSTGKYRDPREVRKALRAVRERFGYPWLTSHELGRKTVATILDNGGASARDIADMLGHARPSMTEDVYMARGRPTTRQAELLETALADAARPRQRLIG